MLSTTRGSDDSNDKVLISTSTILNNAWIIDSTFSHNMTFYARQIKNIKPSSQKILAHARTLNLLS